MQDFRSFNKPNDGKKETKNSSLESLITSLVGKYNGKNENEILDAILKEAKKGRENGTLTNQDIDRFATMLSPFLDSKQREKLKEVCLKLKEI